MSKPTWKIHTGDCLEFMRSLPDGSVDAVVTDPPYGIDYGKAGGFSASHGWGPWRENVTWDQSRPSKEIFDAILSLKVPTVIWGGNYFTDYLLPSMGWIAWDKGQRDFSLADFELAWTSEHKASRCVVFPRSRAVLDGKEHPTQKPIWVMKQCLDFLQRGNKKPISRILDPFCGSGTTGVACIQTGRNFIGCEIDPGYADIARRRCQEAEDSFGLLDYVTNRETQGELL